MTQRRFYHCPLMFVTIVLILAGSVVCAQPLAIHIPDSNLHNALREALNLPAGSPVTEAEMRELTSFNAERRQITDLTGLEYATNLTDLRLGENPIADINPLADLTQLTLLRLNDCRTIADITPLAGLVQLQVLDLDRNLILDIGPLADLTALESLDLRYNQIEDVSPLANLTQLTRLLLNNNEIVDVRPLANLTRLEVLHIQANSITDHSPLDSLSVTDFLYDQTCETSPLPLTPRLTNRTYPSVMGAQWLFGPDSRINLLYGTYFGLDFRPDGNLVGRLDYAIQKRDELIAENPNMVFLVGISMRDAAISKYGEDWPYWVRDASGDIVPEGYNTGAALMDFTHPAVQDLIVAETIEVSKCGLFDGIIIDWWSEESPVLPVHVGGVEKELKARLNILTRTRAVTRPNFLIQVNARKIPHTKQYINGLAMETGLPAWYSTEAQLENALSSVEDTLLWAEENLREPRINGVAGEVRFLEDADSPDNRRWVRLLTTLSLTHANGYVVSQALYGKDWGTWYNFWDADLGRPVGEKGQLYQEIEGLYIREFTNGWAVYNHSGETQEITLPELVTGVASGIEDTMHTLPNLDGEMYLRVKSANPADVNGDGVVNVFDLIIVAQAIGTDGMGGDVNGDGVVNVFDLVFVAGAIGGGGAAPSASSLDPSIISAADVERWLTDAQGLGVGDANFQRGIRFLEGLLAALTPKETTLLPNYPNPFNPETWIPYRLAAGADVEITIFDAKGALVRRLALGNQAAGFYAERGRAAYWDGRNEDGESVASGIYVYHFQAGDYAASRRMVIVK